MQPFGSKGATLVIDQNGYGTDAASFQAAGATAPADTASASIVWSLDQGTGLIKTDVCSTVSCTAVTVDAEAPKPIPGGPPTVEGPNEPKAPPDQPAVSNYDPRVDMAAYATQLLADNTKTDCLKLALMAYKAGQLGSNLARDKVFYLLNTLTEYSWFYLTSQPASDPSFRVGVALPQLGGFGDSGFKLEFQDQTNQVRHFTGFFAAGYSLGIPATDIGLYFFENTMSSSNSDVALGEAAAFLGGTFFGDHQRLAQDIWRSICGQTTPLQLP